MSETPDKSSIRISFSERTDLWGRFLGLLAWIVTRIIGLHKVQNLHVNTRKAMPEAVPDPALAFVDGLLQNMGVRYDLSAEELSRIPATGPVIVVANHPYGGLDGIIWSHILRRVRPDSKIMANYMLASIPEMRDLFFFVDPFGKKASAKKNFGPLKDAMRWLKDGHMLAVFPAGEVSSFNTRVCKVVDPPWTNQVARLVRKTGATVLPVHFSGRNSWFFQAAGLIHPVFRTLLLCREVMSKGGRTIQVNVGAPVPSKKLTAFEKDEDMMAYLRLRTYNLRYCGTQALAEARSRMVADNAPDAPATRRIKDKKETLIREIDNLPEDCLLTENNDFRVYIASAWQIPNVLQMIGRYRELAFSEVGEGTGNAIDLDVFDNYYKHLFLWHKQDQQVGGAYRIGETDLILSRFGKRGVYTTTLFRMNRAFFRKMGPALEMGRSFICPAYQRQAAPLRLLWQGLCVYLLRNPRYTVLFGPVSISNDYQDMSRRYMVEFLTRQRLARAMAKHVRPKNPPRFRAVAGRELKEHLSVITGMEELTTLVRDVEPDGKDIPILLKHYFRLGGTLAGFNVDHDFGNALDALIIVDVPHVDPRILVRFFNGRDNVEKYLSTCGRRERLVLHTA